ncbi:Protein CBG23684 [Caenorhabditis briggsae]|uniref:Protein CBG23684 n=1 Tax=Caenorhabditis briggsae TaxID=6238 RepID=A8WJ28_CAEBR|nr:Protein CBG23684 [Caenorhabditis briggsae]CAP20472.2 Protein CBG23684 [Caenorhabditis briggsae]
MDRWTATARRRNLTADQKLVMKESKYIFRRLNVEEVTDPVAEEEPEPWMHAEAEAERFSLLRPKFHIWTYSFRPRCMRAKDKHFQYFPESIVESLIEFAIDVVGIYLPDYLLHGPVDSNHELENPGTLFFSFCFSIFQIFVNHL